MQMQAALRMAAISIAFATLVLLAMEDSVLQAQFVLAMQLRKFAVKQVESRCAYVLVEPKTLLEYAKVICFTVNAVLLYIWKI